MEYYNLFFKRIGFFLCESTVSFEQIIHRCVLSYGDDPNSFSSEIEHIDLLREYARMPDVSNLKKTKEYLCQLQFLKARATRMNILPTEKVSWTDTFFNEKIDGLTIYVDEIFGLYNIALMLPQSVKQSDFSDKDAYLRALCIAFQRSSGCIEILLLFTENLGIRANPQHYRMLSKIFLIFAQICVYLKCSNDFSAKSPLPLIIIHLIDELEDVKKDISLQNTKKSFSQFITNWAEGLESYFKVQINHFYGEKEVAADQYGRGLRFYKDALGSLKLCENSRYKEIIPDFNELKKLSAKIKEEHDSAEKTNNFVYYHSVPNTLDYPVSGKKFVKSLKLNMYEDSGPDLFSRLVSLKSHEMSSIYSEYKAKLLRSIADEISAQDDKIQDSMTGFNMKIVEDIIKGRLSDFSERITKCMLFSDKNSGKCDKVTSQFEELENVLAQIKDRIKSIDAKIAELKKSPVTLKEKMENDQRLFEKLKSNHESLRESDRQILTALEQIITIMNTLTDRRELKNHLTDPTSFIDEELMADVYTFRELTNKIGRLTDNKQEMMNSLREDALKDDVTQRLAQSTHDPDSGFFEKRLEKYNPQIEKIRGKMAEQDEVFSQLQKLHLKIFTPLKTVHEAREARVFDEADIERRLDMLDEVISNAEKTINSRNTMKRLFDDFYRNLCQGSQPPKQPPPQNYNRVNSENFNFPRSQQRFPNVRQQPPMANYCPPYPPWVGPVNPHQGDRSQVPMYRPNMNPTPQQSSNVPFLSNHPPTVHPPTPYYNPTSKPPSAPCGNPISDLQYLNIMTPPPEFPVKPTPSFVPPGVRPQPVNKFSNIHENPYFKMSMRNQDKGNNPRF